MPRGALGVPAATAPGEDAVRQRQPAHVGVRGHPDSASACRKEPWNQASIPVSADLTRVTIHLQPTQAHARGRPELVVLQRDRIVRPLTPEWLKIF